MCGGSHEQYEAIMEESTATLKMLHVSERKNSVDVK